MTFFMSQGIGRGERNARNPFQPDSNGELFFYLNNANSESLSKKFALRWGREPQRRARGGAIAPPL